MGWDKPPLWGSQMWKLQGTTKVVRHLHLM
jgi:hypothetical protein